MFVLVLHYNLYTRIANLNVGLLNRAGDFAVTFSLARCNVRTSWVNRNAVNVVSVASVVALRVRLEVVEHCNSSDVINNLPCWKVVEIRIAMPVYLTPVPVDPFELELQRRFLEWIFWVPGFS